VYDFPLYKSTKEAGSGVLASLNQLMVTVCVRIAILSLSFFLQLSVKANAMAMNRKNCFLFFVQ